MAKRTSKKMPGFGEKMRALEGIVERLEREDLPLEEALSAFEEGVKLSRECREMLEAAQKKVEILLRDAKGDLVAEPFDPGAPDDDAEDKGKE